MTARQRGPLIRSAALAAASLAAFAALAGCRLSTSGAPITTASDVAVGDCLTVGTGLIDARKSTCDTDAKLTFYAASIVGRSGDCTRDSSAYLFEGPSLDFDGDGDKVCLTPNLAVSSCYQIPLPSGKLTDFRKVECGTRAAASTVVSKLVERAEADVVCTGDTMKWAFTEPSSIGYCLSDTNP